MLTLGSHLSFPVDAITQTFLVVGKRGSGKSNTAARLVEQFYRARLPFVVLDPVDTWWGLKAGRDGGKGLDVYVFGGRKQDLPLEAGGGALIADVLCEHRLSMVLSVKHLSGRERSRFMVAFAQTLFQKWRGGPLHVVLEEAHELAPQMSGGGSQRNNEDGDAAMLGAFKRLWKLGRSSGIGGTAVTQRPASLSKDITTQSEILIAHRTIGPQDVKAIGEWVKYHGERGDILADLPTLPNGEAFVWAPEFPEGQPIGLRRVPIHRRQTFDSAATPKVGGHVVEPKDLAAVDLDRLRAKMAATIERAKQDDPKELRKELASVRQQLAKAQQGSPSNQQASAVSVQPKEVPVLTDADRDRLQKLAGDLSEMRTSLDRLVAVTVANIRENVEVELASLLGQVGPWQHGLAQRLEKAGFQRILEKLERVSAAVPQPPSDMRTERHTPQRSTAGQSAAARPSRTVLPSSAAAGELDGAQRKILTTIAMLDARGLTPNREMVARWMGIHPNGGRYNTNLAALRADGYLDGLRLTERGAAAAESSETGLDAAKAALDATQRQIVDVLAGSLDPLSREQVAAALGIHPNGGRYNTNLGRLRTMGLIPERGPIRLTPEALR